MMGIVLVVALSAMDQERLDGQGMHGVTQNGTDTDSRAQRERRRKAGPQCGGQIRPATGSCDMEIFLGGTAEGHDIRLTPPGAPAGTGGAVAGPLPIIPAPVGSAHGQGVHAIGRDLDTVKAEGCIAFPIVADSDRHQGFTIAQDAVDPA